MPTRTRDYPVYTYDEPAVYRDFSGGINSNVSNERLSKNELRDCVNMHYLSGALVKRKGAKKLCDISCKDVLVNIQGIFLYTYRITYIIVAADGKLYQGIFNDETTIELSRLQIVRTKINEGFLFDPEDAFAGIEEKQPSEILSNSGHEGYIQTYFRNTSNNELYTKNERGSYFDIEGGAINIGDVFIETNNIIERKYLCIKTFDKIYEYPNELLSWELVDEFTYIENGKTKVIYPDEVTDDKLISLKGYGLSRFDISDLKQWTTKDTVLYEGRFYKCTNPHYNRYSSIYDTSLFVDVSNISSSNFIEEQYMLFQNYRKVEAATLNNKMYIATGTRIIEVYLDSNELIARPITPYQCNGTEITKIGYNYLSPYPELAVASQTNTVTTSISGINIRKTVGNRFLLTPVMNVQIGDDVKNYYFRWEKFVNGAWHVLIPFKSQKIYEEDEDGNIVIQKNSYSYIEVDDADKCNYRCTFAKSFELEPTIVDEWDINKNHTLNEYVSVGIHIYRCLKTHKASEVTYANNEFQTEAVMKADGKEVVLWQEIFTLEKLPYVYQVVEEDEDGNRVVKEKYDTVWDYVISKTTGDYFGSATSVIFNNDLKINDNFLLIHSCTKVIADGQKLLFYSDRFSSGQWFKTIINNANYIANRGNLSFKTNKNESVIKVVPFQGNLIVFANSDNVGGSIHLVAGNGDDYDDQSGYYSPYQRRTINSSISSSNADSIQVCDNIIVFKYFNRVYYINASDLNNDTVKVVPCNDRVISTEGEVQIPWDDDSCISESNREYYSLIWKEQFAIDENDGELIKVRPAIRVKLYYKMSMNYDDGSIAMPWLRDESNVFNASHIIYVKGRPLYLYNNVLVSFDDNYYKDINSIYECKIHCKGVGCNYDSFYKLIENVTVGFHRNQFKNIDINVIIKNEAGHILLDSASKKNSSNDLGVLHVGKRLNKDEATRIGSTIQDNKMFITVNKFPCLLVDTSIYVNTDSSFTLSSLTYQYTSIDMPDTNPADTYSNIIRYKQED